MSVAATAPPWKLALYPVIGLALGVLATLAAWAGDALSPVLGGLAAVATLEAATRLGPRRALATAAGGPVAALALVLKAAAAAAIPPGARTTVLLLAPLLGRWATVVQRYGGTRLAPQAAEDAPGARADFGAFGVASLVTFAVTLSLAEAVGLLLLLAAALVTLGVRAWGHRRLGGLAEAHVTATGELVETAVLAVVALLVQVALYL